MINIEYIEDNIKDILKNIESKDIYERDKLIAIDIFLHKREHEPKESMELDSDTIFYRRTTLFCSQRNISHFI